MLGILQVNRLDLWTDTLLLLIALYSENQSDQNPYDTVDAYSESSLLSFPSTDNVLLLTILAFEYCSGQGPNCRDAQSSELQGATDIDAER